MALKRDTHIHSIFHGEDLIATLTGHEEIEVIEGSQSEELDSDGDGLISREWLAAVHKKLDQRKAKVYGADYIELMKWIEAAIEGKHYSDQYGYKVMLIAE